MFAKIRKIAALLLVPIMLLSIFASCSKSDVPDGYQLAVCEGDKFRLYVPTQGWMPNTAGGVSGAFFSGQTNVTVNVFVADDAEDMTVEEYWKICDKNYAKELKNYSYSGKSEKLTLGGQPARKYIYSAEQTVNGVTETYKYMQVMARYEGEMYILLYSAIAGEEYYDSHVEDVENGIIPYFVFSKPYSSGEKKEYSDKVDVPEGMKLISTDERGYRFYVPEKWIVNKRTEATAAYYSDSDKSNVSVQIYMADNNVRTIDDYFGSCESGYKNIFSSYTLISSSDIKMSNISAKQYVISVTSDGTEYKMLQAIVKKGAYFYCVTYTATPENYDSHIDDVNKMIENFEIR